MQEYNGHPSWAAWNVSLWLCNEEPLYRLALYHLGRAKTIQKAAAALQADLPSRTPDGARYSLRSLVLALKDLQ